MGYLFKPDPHTCDCPNPTHGPDDRRVRQSTKDRVGTIWQCDECGKVWQVKVLVGDWRAYCLRQPTRRELRRRERELNAEAKALRAEAKALRARIAEQRLEARATVNEAGGVH